jgi:hypothetical protein
MRRREVEKVLRATKEAIVTGGSVVLRGVRMCRRVGIRWF